MKDPLQRVTGGGLCAGCGACTHLGSHIQIRASTTGFLRPEATRKLNDDEARRFKEFCPSHGLTLNPADTSPVDPLWGPVISARTGFADDPSLRHAAASGGALSALIVHLLDEDLVDAIIHVGASESPVYANRTVVSRTAEDVVAAAGSRYAPSAPLDGISDRLDGVTRYAFVGKPCDVAALRGLARQDPRIDLQIPYMLSFFCAGVPSHRGAEQVLDQLNVDLTDLASFRYRGNGWPGRATATKSDGTMASMSYEQSWGDILAKHVQLRCRICPDGVGSFADVACADAWETSDGGSPLFDERDGVSFILTRTPRGEELVQSAVATRRLHVQPARIDDLTTIQPGQYFTATTGPARLWALRVLGRPTPRFRGFSSLQRLRRAGVRTAGRQFLGTLKRASTGRLNY